MTVPVTELARVLCDTAHPLLRSTGAIVPCGTHITEATRYYGLIQPSGGDTLRIINAAAITAIGGDIPTSCEHDVVGSMAPIFPGTWACLRCGVRFEKAPEEVAFDEIVAMDGTPVEMGAAGASPIGESLPPAGAHDAR